MNEIPALQGILPVCSSCRKKLFDEVQDKKTEYSQCTPDSGPILVGPGEERLH